jgi:hypothetical protein
MRRSAGGVLAAVMTAVVLFALAGYQVTSETAATRLLGRLAAALVEIDRWLPAHREDIDLLARDDPQAAVRLADLPIEVSLPAPDVIAAEPEVLRDRIVRVMGGVLYADGSGAFRGDDGEGHLGIDEPARWTASLLSRGAHSFWKAALPLTLLVLLALAAATLHGGAAPLPALIAGAALAALASGGVWLLAQLGEALAASAIDREIMLILRDGAWIGLRDALAVVVAGIALRFLLNLARGDAPWPALQPPPDAPYV